MKEEFDGQLKFKFLTNNVKGLHSNQHVKILEYFRNKVTPEVILLLHETLSSVQTEEQWNGKFKGHYIFLTVRLIHVVFLLDFMETLML